jgi:hypothetical protein
LLGALNLDWSVWANVGAIAGGLALLGGALAATNRARGRRALARPDRVGKTELALFVVVPALLPLIFGGQLVSALVTMGGNVALLAAVYLVVGYGFLSILRWALGELPRGLASSLALLTRAVPLLLFFALVLFLTTEMWQVFAELPWALMGLVGALFALVAGVFLGGRLPREVRALEADAGAGGPPLNRRQRINVGLVMFVSQALQVAVVSVAFGGFFAAFGALAIGPDVLKAWIGTTGNEVIPSFDLFGQTITVTEELLRVSGVIAVFTGLYFAIAVLTDETYRQEFLDELVGELRDTFRLRAEYLRQLGGPAS